MGFLFLYIDCDFWYCVAGWDTKMLLANTAQWFSFYSHLKAMGSAPTSSDLSNLAHCHADPDLLDAFYTTAPGLFQKLQGSNKPVINYSTQLQNIWVNIEKSLNGSVTNQTWIKNVPPCKWLLTSLFSSQWSPVVFIENRKFVPAHVKYYLVPFIKSSQFVCCWLAAHQLSLPWYQAANNSQRN